MTASGAAPSLRGCAGLRTWRTHSPASRAVVAARAAVCALLLHGNSHVLAQVPTPVVTDSAAVRLHAAADTACVLHLRSAEATGPAADLARVLQLHDSTARTSFLLRRVGRPVIVRTCVAPAAVGELASRLATTSTTQGIQPVPAELQAVGNSAYPRDWNNGTLWAGRGLNLSLSAGVELRWGRLTAAIAPVVAWQSNATYDTRALIDTAGSPYRHPWWGIAIDAPQRFGAGSFATVDGGHSFVRLDVGGFATGISHEMIVWGPARRQPLVLSATAPGFAHVFVETARPVDAWIGALEFQLFWGRLTESAYFDNDPDNDHRTIAGLLIALQPRILDGLALGFGRTHSVTWWPGFSLADVVLGPYRGVGENPQGRDSGDNQLLTFFFRWSDAPLGLEVYGEWAREDHWGPWVGLLRNLDASQGYTLGLQKVIRRGDNALRLATEITHLSDALPVLFASRGVLPFYIHNAVTQGHTHRGQLLGAGIGTGAESQWIGADYFWRGGRTGISLERARYEEDAYHMFFAPAFGAEARDTEISLRAAHMTAFESFSLDAELGWSIRHNRGFFGLDNVLAGGEHRRDQNLSVRLGARWNPRLGR